MSRDIVLPMSRDITFVEVRGFEPLTFCMPCRRATNCAIPPNGCYPQGFPVDNSFIIGH